MGVIAFEDVYGPFYGQLPAEDEQSAFERRVTRLLDDWDNAQDSGRRDALVAGMRAVVRSEVG